MKFQKKKIKKNLKSNSEKKNQKDSKSNSEKKDSKSNAEKTSTECITEVMSQAAKEPQQDGTSQHLLS